MFYRKLGERFKIQVSNSNVLELSNMNSDPVEFVLLVPDGNYLLSSDTFKFSIDSINWFDQLEAITKDEKSSEFVFFVRGPLTSDSASGIITLSERE